MRTSADQAVKISHVKPATTTVHARAGHWARLLGLLLTAVLATILTVRGLWAEPEVERTLAIYNIHTKEQVEVVYKRHGQYVPSGVKKLNWAMRDWRRDEPTKMDLKLLDLLWEVHTELGSKKPIHLISGYRSQKTNNMLRKTRGGQARKSQHILGRAADVHFPDISVKQLRYSALVREQGGVGYYPTSAIPFVHIDTGRVRHWPRMRRHELALLFPSGRSKHRPKGGPLRKRDVQVARAKYASLAKRINAFRQKRTAAKARLKGQEPTLFAAARTAPATGATVVAALTPEPAEAANRTARASASPAPAPALLASAAELLGARSWTIPEPALTGAGQLASRAQPAAPRNPGSKDHNAPRLDGPALTARPAPSADARNTVPRVADLLAGPGLSASNNNARAALPSEVTAAARDLAGTADNRAQGAPERLARLTPAGAPLSDQARAPVAASGQDAGRVPKEPTENLAAYVLRSATDVFLEMTGWASAPEFDVDHPDELNYRPFPVEAVFTADPLNGDRALSTLISPDFAGTRAWIAKPDRSPPLRLRPDSQLAALVWSSTFANSAPNAALERALGRTVGKNGADRRVRTDDRQAAL